MHELRLRLNEVAEARQASEQQLGITRNSNTALVEALRTLLDSLDWEAKRSGTTYNGYEQARAALALAEGEGS